MVMSEGVRVTLRVRVIELPGRTRVRVRMRVWMRVRVVLGTDTNKKPHSGY